MLHFGVDARISGFPHLVQGAVTLLRSSFQIQSILNAKAIKDTCKLLNFLQVYLSLNQSLKRS